MKHSRAVTNASSRRPNRSRYLALVAVGMTASLTVAGLTLSNAVGASPPAPSSHLSHLSVVTTVASTVPANGDVNPYGSVVVPQTIGKLVRGSTLVSNFNNSANLQGTGTTIVEITPSGVVTTFSQLNEPLPGRCPGGIGLSLSLIH